MWQYRKDVSQGFYSSSVHKSKVRFNKCFSYDAPKLWNDLPLEIQTAPTLSYFKRRLKTYLFQKSFPPPLDDDLIMFYELLICEFQSGLCALESSSLEIKHMNT